MAKRKPASAEPAIRKSFLYMGAVAIGVSVLGFVLMNVVLGGGGAADEETAVLSTVDGPTAPGLEDPVRGTEFGADPVSPEDLNTLNEGGRDPFSPVIGASPPTPPPPPAPEGEGPPPVIAPEGEGPPPVIAPEGEGPPPAPAP